MELSQLKERHEYHIFLKHVGFWKPTCIHIRKTADFKLMMSEVVKIESHFHFLKMFQNSLFHFYNHKVVAAIEANLWDWAIAIQLQRHPVGPNGKHTTTPYGCRLQHIKQRQIASGTFISILSLQLHIWSPACQNLLRALEFRGPDPAATWRKFLLFLIIFMSPDSYDVNSFTIRRHNLTL